MKKKLLAVLICITMTFSLSVPVFADRESDLTSSNAQAKSQLSDMQSRLAQTEAAQDALKGEISSLNSNLVNLLANIDVLKTDITSMESRIEATKTELAGAEADRDKQFNNMKVRIQYIYENGGQESWAKYLLEAADITEFLNRASYTESIQEYDREMLQKYADTVTSVSNLKTSLESQKSELEDEEKNLELQQQDLSASLAEKQAASSDYDSQIAEATKQAGDLKNLILQQNEEIKAIRAEKEKAAEQAAKESAAAAESAAKAAAASAAASASDSKNVSVKTVTAPLAAAASETENKAAATENTKAAPAAESTGTETSETESKKQTSSSSSGSSSAPASSVGGAAASYACGFIGNPYVWGGESLTGGADCSGFVKAVYAHFGVDLPHSSADLAGVGVGVSYADAQPGDLICYSGHVAIYIGDGAIVHASNERDGIKISDDAAYRTIIAVRRITG